MADIAVLGLKVDSTGAVKATDNLDRSLNQLGATATKSEKSIGSFVAKMVTIGSVSIGFASALKQAMDFEKQMALVATVTDQSTASVLLLGKATLQLFRNLPVGSLQEMTKGLYDIISAGIPAGDAIKYLDVAARAAIAGVTSTATAVDALTTVTNAWRGDNITAAEAADKMFQAVNKGKITFEELAASIGIIAPVAAAYKIKLEDVLGATAQLTLGGQNASVALTGIRSAIVNIINPTDEWTKKFPALAKEFNATKLEAVGFSQFLIELNARVGGSKEALNALFTDIQGKTSVFSLLADGGVGLQKQLDAVAKSSGAAGAAFNEINKTSAAAYQTVKNQLTAALTELGSRALPLVVDAAKGLLAGIEFLRNNLPYVVTVLAMLTGGWVAYAAAAKAAAAWTAIMGAVSTISAFLSLARVIRTVADAMALLSIVGKGAAGAIAAIAAIAAGFIAYKATVKALEKDQKAYNDELKRTEEALLAAAGAAGVTPGAPPPTPPVTPTGATDEEAKALAKILEDAKSRVRVAQQTLDLVGKIGLEEGLQVIRNKAINDTLAAQAELKGEGLRKTLDAIAAEEQLSATTLIATRARELGNQNDDRVRLASQALELVGLEGVALQKIQLSQKTTNDILEARRTLTGQELFDRLEALDLEEAYTLSAIEGNAALDARRVKQEQINAKAKQYIAEEQRIREQFEKQLQQTFANGFAQVFTNGLKGFQSFFASIKELFIRTISDMLAASATKKLAGMLGNIALGKPGSASGATTSVLPGAFAAAGASYLVGSAIGGATTSRTVGAIGGAVGGAATGAAIGAFAGGPLAPLTAGVGAIIGGFVGAIGGFISASKNATQELIAQKLAQKSLNEAMVALRASFSNDTLGQAVAQARVQFNQLREQTEKAYSGKKNEAERNKLLAELNTLEAQRVQQLKDEYEETQRRAQQDLEVRRLIATGDAEGAASKAFANAQERELADARKAGADAATLAAIAETQLAEASARAAQRAETARRTVFDLQTGAQAFTDPRGAGNAAFVEEQSRRVFDAIQRGASEAELAAIAFFNAAEAANREAEQLEEDTRRREGLLSRGIAVTGTSREAEDFNRNARNRQENKDAEQLSEADRALIRFVQFAEGSQVQMLRAIEDGTKAIQERAKNEIAANNLLIDAIRMDSAKQLAKLDEQIEATTLAARATAKRFDEQIVAVKEQTKVQLDAIDAQIEASRGSLDVANKQVSALEKSVQTNSAVVAALTDFTNASKLGALSTFSPEQKLAEARAQFEVLASAAAGGDATAAQGLPGAANALLQASRDFNASNSGFVEDFNRVQDVIGAITTQFGATLPIDQQALVAAQQQVEGINATINALGKQKDTVQAASEKQLQALNDAKDKAVEDAQRIIDALNDEKDKIGADAQAQIEKLQKLNDTIEAGVKQQVDALVKVEEEAHKTRLAQDAYWQTYLDLLAANSGISISPREGPTPVVISPENNPVASAQLEEQKRANTILTDRLAALEERMVAAIGVAVAASEEEVSVGNRIIQALATVAAETRNAANAAVARSAPRAR